MSLKQVSLRWVSVLLLVLGFAACQGDTDGGKAADETFNGEQFQPDDNNSGRIEIDLNSSRIAVSQIDGFTVTVYDRNGVPVPQVRVNCDSEAGLAIIEPSLGAEHTSSNGSISGKIGCALPGSFQMACRLPGGGNRRKFADVVCTGDIPAGFDGFPGAAGGTLGSASGGVQNPGDGEGGPGGADSDSSRLIAIVASETGGNTSNIDTTLDTCDAGTPADATDDFFEPFTDTTIAVKVVNNSNSLVRFTSLSYSVANFDGTGRTFQSSRLGIIGETSAASSGGEAEFSTLAFQAGGGGKSFVNFSSGNQSIGNVGFRNVTVTVRGETELGEEVAASGTVVLSFLNYDNCGDE